MDPSVADQTGEPGTHGRSPYAWKRVYLARELQLARPPRVACRLSHNFRTHLHDTVPAVPVVRGDGATPAAYGES